MIDKLGEEGKKIGLEVKERVGGYLIGALGLVAGLAWNDAIKALIEYSFPLNKDTVSMKFLYAIIITLVIVIATVYLSRLLQKKKDEEGK